MLARQLDSYKNERHKIEFTITYVFRSLSGNLAGQIKVAELQIGTDHHLRKATYQRV
jgi:hypothetical protein